MFWMLKSDYVGYEKLTDIENHRYTKLDRPKSHMDKIKHDLDKI